jgi:hypothetical protein
VIIFVNTEFDILTTPKDKELSIMRLLKMHAITFLFLGSIYLLYRLAGLGGVVGVFAVSILLLVFFVAWALYQNWKVYDAVTSWGAKRIKGKTKDDFDLAEVLKR